ncbi:MAG: GtrA family protein [Burkholderiaceae bacterium]|nr:GtrA family protein [Burkholderiaceae bacterium]
MPRFLRFLLVGVLNTGFSYSLYTLLLWSGLHFAAANLCATLAGIAFSFRTQGALVFGSHDWRLLRRFVPVWIGIYAVNVGIIALLVRADLNAYAAGAVALPPTVLLSFLLQKRFVFAPAGGKASLGS